MAPTSPSRTRFGITSKLTKLIGTGREFLPSEVPTLRSVIRKGIFIQEENLHDNVTRNNYSIKEMALDLASEVCALWKKSNAQFEIPVIFTKKSVARKIVDKWEKVRKAANNLGKQSDREKVIAELDKVFDILNCKCRILLCSDFDPVCNGCIQEVHITCKCPFEQKIPKLDLLWVFSQRTKEGDKSTFQFGYTDKKETKRQMEAKKRQVEEIGRNVKYLKSEEERPIGIQEMPINIEMSSNEVSLESVDYLPSQSYNTFKLVNTVAASIRCGVSQSSTSAIVTGFLQDLIDAGHISKDMDDLCCDKKNMES